MIFTDRDITVRKGESKINEPIIVYRGDYELEVRFTIMNSKFKFMSGTNLIESENAAYGQLAILTPYGGNIFSDIAKCNEGTVTFVLTEAMLNQIEEVGLYSFQIRLFDYNKESRVSIPPVEFGIEVREPITSEDHDNSVNNAIVGYSIAKIADALNEKVPDTFDEEGNYNKTVWETGDRITEGKLNKIEDALDKINQNEIADNEKTNKQITSNFNVLSAEIDGNYSELTTKINTKADTSYVNSKVNAVASGSPKGVYATVAALTSAIPEGNSNIYVVSADGCWYYWNGSAWTKGGVYQDTKIADGTITIPMFTTDIQNRIRSSANGEYLPTLTSYPIDIDTTRKVIKIVISGTTGPAFNGTDLNGKFYSVLPDERAVGDVLELDYSSLDSSAIMLCYDLTNEQYVLKTYRETVSNDLIRLLFFRVNNDANDNVIKETHVDANNHMVTRNNGHPTYTMQKQLEIGELSSRYFVKRIWQGNYNDNSEKRSQRKMIVDVANKSITIPTSEFVYGRTAFSVPEPYTITWTAESSLIYVFYNEETYLFEAYGFNSLSLDNLITLNHKLLLYDIYRTSDHRGLYTDEFATVGVTKVEYFDVADILNFANPKAKIISMFREESKLKSYAQRISDEDLLMDHYRPKYDNLSDVATIVYNPELNSFHANCAKITKDDNLFALKIDNKFKVKGEYNYVPAIRFYAYVNDTFTLVHDTEWYTNGDVGANDRYNFTKGNFLKIDNIFNQIEYVYDTPIDTIYAYGVVQKRYATDQEPTKYTSLKTEGNVHFKITPIYYSDTHNKGELTNSVPFEDIACRVTGNSPRWYYILPTSIKGTDNIQVSSKIGKYTIDGVEYAINLAVHYLDNTKNSTFDTNWVYVNGEWECGVDMDVNIFDYWDTRYDPSSFPSKLRSITQTIKAEIYIGLNKLSRTLTDAEIVDLFTQMDLTYEVHPMTEEKLEEIALPSEYKENILLSGTSGGVNIVAASLSELSTYTTATNVATIKIPVEAKGFLVEFRAKVSGDMGYIQFATSAHRMSVVNTGMKAFKMRFNKDDISDFLGDIIITPPSGGSITIQGLKVTPVFDEVPISNHSNAQFYHHRGYSAAYPENTLLAVEESCKRGCTIIEVDTFSSTDDKTLICHDYTLGRTNSEFPNRTYTDATKFTIYSSNTIQVESTLISKFALHEQLTIADNGTDRTAYIIGINTSDNLLTLNINTLTGPITSIQSSGVYVPRCSEAEFLQYDVGKYMNTIFEGELNASFEDYIKVVRRYNAALLLDIRIMSEANFKGQIAELLDKYDYWDKCYFMHSISQCNTYHQWAKDIDRKIVISPILWSSGDSLIADITNFGSTVHSNASRKDIVFQSSAVTEENVALAHSYGMRVHVFTVNSISEAQRVLRMGVDIIGGDYFSDDTAILW